MRSFLDFIKYNNAFPIILAVVILGAGAAFATSSEFRQVVFPYSENTAIIPPKPTNTENLRKKDIKNFDLDVRIDAITEDGKAYSVAYSYTTLEVSNGEWRETRKNGKMDIFKDVLGKRDLKTYLVEQIGQVIDREISYLSEAQRAARADATPQNSQKYAALVGTKVDDSMRDEAEKSHSSMSSLAERTSSESETEDSEETSIHNSGMTLTKEEINEMIVKAVSDFLAIDTSMLEPLPETLQAETSIPVADGVSETVETVTEETAPISEPKVEP